MSAIEMPVSQVLMLLLSILSAPADREWISIDLFGERGYIDTMLVRAYEDGFEIFDENEPGDDMRRWAEFTPRPGKPLIWTFADARGRERTIDLEATFGSLDALDMTGKTDARLMVRLSPDRRRGLMPLIEAFYDEDRPLPIPTDSRPFEARKTQALNDQLDRLSEIRIIRSRDLMILEHLRDPSGAKNSFVVH